MKKTWLTSITVALLGTSGHAQETNPTTTAAADSTSKAPPEMSISSPGMSHDVRPDGGEFEAGLMLGEPTGASLKYWFNDTLAVDGGLGWLLHDDNDFELHGDLLWHKFDVFRVSEGELPVYLGLGGRVRFRDDRDDRVGLRVPVGISYLFQNVPVDVFVEVAPILDVTPAVQGGISAGIGARYRF